MLVYDRQNQTVERVSVAENGAQGNGGSSGPSLSADGRFVAFPSLASNLVPGDTNDTTDAFVYDRQSRTVERVSVAENGTQGNSDSSEMGAPSLSADGRFVAFASAASNLVPGDTNQKDDVFVIPNRRAGGARSVGLYAGQVLSNVDFGLMPNPGEIRGRCFEDVIANGVYDAGEPGRAGSTVYLDVNGNGQLESGELTAQTTADGSYVFAQLPSYQDYHVRLVVPAGFALVLPTPNDRGVWNVFLPAGGTVGDRDFGLQVDQTLGQSENAAVSGRLFQDADGDGQQDPTEPGIPNATLFLDLNGDGIRQFDEERTISAADNPSTPNVDETGLYSFQGLGNRPYTVRVLDVPHARQTTPVGNSFTRQVYSLASPNTPPGNPQDVAVADFNRDGAADLAVAVFDRNAVSLLLNDGNGRFAQPPPEISLAPSNRPTTAPRGVGPIAILAGDFNGQGGADLAVVNNLSSNVTILLDFDGSHFASETYITVGTLPNSVAGADLDGDGDLDLLVTNEWNNTVSILRNDGHGRFTADVTAPATGNHPFDVASGDFNEDGRLDLVVADFGTYPQGGDLGDVRVLLAGSNGAFQSQVACPVGFGPSAIVAADLNGDGHLDLAVANFLSDNVTVCRGLGNGTFQAEATLSGGSGPMDLKAADIDGDGDLDLLVTNGKSQKVAILRNRLSQEAPESFAFEPAESFGVANFPDASQISLATGDLDQNGTMDLAVVNSTDDSVAIHLNSLVGGAHRLGLTGIETITGRDFGFQLVNSLPTLDPLANPGSLNEDAVQQTIPLGGITAGAGEAQVLRVTASSGNTALISLVSVDYTSPAATGTLTFAPTAEQFGQTVITVTVTDGGLDNNLATPDDNAATSRSFTVTVLPVNDPPTLDALPAVLTLDEDAPQQTVNLMGITAGGGESQPLRVTVTTSDAQLLPDLSATYSSPATTAALRFTPAAHRTGSALVTVVVTDGGLDGDLATVADNASLSRVMAVVVRPVSRPPTLDAIGNVTVNEDAAEQVVTLTGITAGGDGDQPLRVTASSDSTALVPTMTVVYTSPGTSGQLKFRPVADGNGQAVITVTVTDGGLDGDLATTGDNGSFARSFTVTVQAVNDPPQAHDDAAPTAENQVLEISWAELFQNDSDVDSPRPQWTVSAVGDAVHGQVSNAPAERRVRFVPEQDYHGLATFVYTLADGNGRSAVATVTVSVAVINDPPVANADTLSTNEDTRLDIAWSTLFQNDTDVDSPRTLWSVAAVGAATHGVVTNDPPQQRVTFQPETDFHGRASFSYTLDDGQGGQSTATVGVDVAAVNYRPTAVALAPPTVTENAVGAVVGLLTASDPDVGDTHTFTVSDGPFEVVGNLLKLKTGRSLDFESTPTVTVSVTASDADGLQVTQPLVITVTDVNEPPTLVAVAPSVVAENAAGAVVGKVTMSDPDLGDTLSVSLSDARFEIVGDQLQLRPGVALNHETEAVVLVLVTARDAAGLSVSSQVMVTVTDVNEAPMAIELQPSLVAERLAGEFIGVVTARDADVGDTLAFSVDDSRFEVVGTALKLKDGIALGRLVEPTVRIQIRATDSAQPPLTLTLPFVLTVTANPFPWSNSAEAEDVDQSGNVAPLDALILITELNRPTVRDAQGYLPAARPARSNLAYFDPFPDGTITPSDVLVVINRLNRGVTQGEAEDVGSLIKGREVATAVAFPPLTPTLSPEYRAEGVVYWSCQAAGVRPTVWGGRWEPPSSVQTRTDGDASGGELGQGADTPGWELDDELLSLLSHDVAEVRGHRRNGV
ncbi:MAG: tandem-95 repeat protein [Planctomycetota bacterium]|nr:tandem-95 repeat protein [Planctomycetota bacterium]